MFTEADLAAHKSRIDRDGYTILVDAIAPELLDGISVVFHPALEVPHMKLKFTAL